MNTQNEIAAHQLDEVTDRCRSCGLKWDHEVGRCPDDRPRRAAHAVVEIVSVHFGAVISCRCGWTHHATPDRDAARAAYRDHKAGL